MHQFYHAVRTSEGEESAEQSGKPRLIIYIFVMQWGRGDVTDRALVSGSSGLGSSPDRGHCVVLCFYTRSASLQPLMLRANPVMKYRPIQEGELKMILLIASCHCNLDKQWPDGPLSLYTDLTTPYFARRSSFNSKWSSRKRHLYNIG